MEYILVDSNHLFARHKFAIKWDDPYGKAHVAVQSVLQGLLKLWTKHKGAHLVFVLEGKSWRHHAAESYKADRRELHVGMTDEQQEADKIFYDTMNKFLQFVSDKTNATVISARLAEADDVIAMWTQAHPDDTHIIYSGDSDFVQLLRPNVSIYDGIKEISITIGGVVNAKGQKMAFDIGNDGRVRATEVDPAFLPADDWVEWCLFLKTMRGDATDRVWRACPKGTRNTKLREAWENRASNGFIWNNLMQADTVDSDGSTKRVHELYARNQEFIDLTRQPEHVKEIVAEAMLRAHAKEPKTNIGFFFYQMVAEFELERIKTVGERVIDMLGVPIGPLNIVDDTAS